MRTCRGDVAVLWSPYVIGQTIYIFVLSFVLLLSFFSSPNLSGRTLDVCHTSTHGVAFVLIYDAGPKRLAGNAGCKKSPKSRHLRTIVQLCWAIPVIVREAISRDALPQYGDGAGNTVEENSSIFSLIRMR